MSDVKFRVYKCKAGHFHLLTGYDVPSFPFWCLGTGFMLIDFCKEQMIDPSSSDAAHEYEKLDALKPRIEQLSRRQCIDSKGRFTKGFFLPRRRPPLNEHSVAEWWAKFFNGEAHNVYVYSELLMRHIPLRCDFIDRPGDEKQLGLFQLERLKAKPRTVRELGIDLQE